MDEIEIAVEPSIANSGNPPRKPGEYAYGRTAPEPPPAAPTDITEE